MYKRNSGIGVLRAGVLLAIGCWAGAGLSAQTAPLPVAAAGGPANIFYGGINPAANTNSPVLLFVHGLGTNGEYWFTNGNTMYESVYNSGFRSAYISMNADNSKNTAPIAQNAATLQALMPIILAHFGVQQVYLVCHSKGGLDAQMAMMDPGFRSEVKSIFNLATPNQGTALADWAYGPGAKIASLLGLQSPGLFDLRPENVAVLRAQFDPVFATAGVPFYYMEGSQYSGQQSIVYDITGPILMNLANGSKDDGLVAVSEVTLPDSYSEDLGSVSVDHTAMGFGVNTYPFIYGRIAGLETRLAGWQQVASGGFGDDANTWNWSQTWYKGNLYVGTGRNTNCVIDDTAATQTGLPLYPSPGTSCPLDPLQIASGAEIWRYTPQTKTWTRVYKSVQDIPLGIGQNGQPQFAAESIGFRSFGLYTEADGTDALYVGGVSANSIYNQLPQYANFSYPPPIMLRSTDGQNFNEIPEDPGTFMGDIVKNNTDIVVCSFRSIVQANGQMWVAVTDFRGQGFIIASPNPSQGDNAFQRVSVNPSVPNFAVWVLSAFNNAVYVGTGDRTQDDGYAVYKSTNVPGDPVPYTFTPIILQGGWQVDEAERSPTALTMHVWTEPDDNQPHLFVGTDRKIEIVRVNTDDTWDVVMGQPRSTPDGFKAPLSGIGYYFDNDFSGHIWQIQDSGSHLFASTWDWSVLLRTIGFISPTVAGEQGFDFFQTPDGVHFYIVSKDGMGDGLNDGGRSGNYNHFGMFWGTARSEGGSQVWQNNTVLDLNGDGRISMADANIIQAAMGQAVTGFDARDVNGNGVIDGEDVQYLETQCTFPNCSEVPPPGIAYTPPAPTFQGFLTSGTQAAVGNTVTLQWPAQPNVARYHVFRYTATGIVQLVLDGFPSQTLQISPSISFQFPNDVMAGKLAQYCPANLADDLWYCQLNTLTQQSSTPPASGTLGVVGFPSALVEIAQTTALTYAEPMPTNVQSLYFIRSEDQNGNLSQASNIVGAPSFQAVPQAQ